MLISTVENFLKKYDLLNGHKTLIVGFSGGYDSLCLLHILNKLSITHNFVVVAAHLNHNWRGMESLIEQDECRKFCKKEGIEFYTKTAPADLKHTETVARMARYAFFKEALKEYDADAVLTAHNKDDNVETIIYRIAKGTGTKGLQGIQEHRDIYYRPLLNTYREDIENYCKTNRLSPNNDSSNANTIYKRNFIRHEILPMMSVINKNVKDAINSLITVTKDEGSIIDEYLANIKLEIFDGNRILTPRYRKLSQEVKRRIIYDLICNANIEYDYTKIMQIYDFIESNMSTLAGSTHSLTKDLWVYASARSIEFITKSDKIDDEIEISEYGEYYIDSSEFKIEEFDGKLPENLPKEEATNGIYKAYVDLSNFDMVFTLRTRQDGDVINPLGMIGTMKLKKYLNAKKIPAHERDNLALFCLGSEVLWIPGVGISNKIKISNGKTPTHMLSFKKR